MSGGSYNYLYCAEEMDDLLEKKTALKQMLKRLKEIDRANLAYQETLNLLIIIENYENYLNELNKKINKKISELQEIWKAIELVDSHDLSEDELSKAVNEFNIFHDNEKS